MAHTKAVGTTQLGRDSLAKYRGVKLHDGQPAKPGNIIVRQTGSKFLAGTGVRTGSDYTLYAAVGGIVKYSRRKKKRYDGSRRTATVVNVTTS